MERPAAYLLALCLLTMPSLSSPQILEHVPLEEFCVTEGHLEESAARVLLIDEAKTRAVLRSKTPSTAQIDFRYLAPTHEQSALGSGEIRTQIGLKLKAQDACNLVYVMWRIQPESRVVVSIKSNPGQHSSSQCGNRGYTNMKGKEESAVAPLQIGTSHSLRAELVGSSLVVRADGTIVWNGLLPESAADFDGPVGFRSDNGRFELNFYAPAPSGHLGCPLEAAIE
jgi:hypothetical protein